MAKWAKQVRLSGWWVVNREQLGEPRSAIARYKLIV